jgi:hypothetical protein
MITGRTIGQIKVGDIAEFAKIVTDIYYIPALPDILILPTSTKEKSAP